MITYYYYTKLQNTSRMTGIAFMHFDYYIVGINECASSPCGDVSLFTCIDYVNSYTCTGIAENKITFQ